MSLYEKLQKGASMAEQAQTNADPQVAQLTANIEQLTSIVGGLAEQLTTVTSKLAAQEQANAEYTKLKANATKLGITDKLDSVTGESYEEKLESLINLYNKEGEDLVPVEQNLSKEVGTAAESFEADVNKKEPKTMQEAIAACTKDGMTAYDAILAAQKEYPKFWGEE